MCFFKCKESVIPRVKRTDCACRARLFVHVMRCEHQMAGAGRMSAQVYVQALQTSTTDKHTESKTLPQPLN